jgi:hypothetical protein
MTNGPLATTGCINGFPVHSKKRIGFWPIRLVSFIGKTVELIYV